MNNPFDTIMQQLQEIDEKLKSITSQDKRPLTIEEAVEFTQRTKSSIYTLVSRGEIPFYKRSGRLYFLQDELMDWIKSEPR